jgi:small conductance mechanosensitive channel
VLTTSPRVLARDDEPDGLEPALNTVTELYNQLVGALPLVVIALVLAALGIMVAAFAARSVERALGRTKADEMAAGLVGRIVRVLLVVSTILLALAVAGVEVGPALAGLGLAGLAVALALQGILENFIAGIILMARKPFRPGDQICSNDLEGTVQDIDTRVTRLLSYDGETVLIPNIEVFRQPLVNFTRRGSRRSCVLVGVDYRDDHDAAREVIRRAVEGVEGVWDQPPPEVWMTELGDSSVDFEVMYWTAPHKLEVRRTQDRVLGAVKSAIEDAGMTIPWPIRTLVVDSPVTLQREESRR